MNSTDLTHLVQLAASKAGHRLFRFNVGTFRTEDGRWINIGVKGGSDLVGISSRGRFIGIEIKPPGPDRTPKERRARQAAFLDMIRQRQGIAGIARSVEEALDIIGEG